MITSLAKMSPNAKYAVPDPDWEKDPPPRTYNTSKTQTGEKKAAKIRDLRLRKNLTGSTANPRLRQKTRPEQNGLSAQVDFEEEVRKYKQDIKEDIEQYKKNKNMLSPNRSKRL